MVGDGCGIALLRVLATAEVGLLERRHRRSDESEVTGVPYELAEGMPVLHGVLAWLVCGLEQELPFYAVLLAFP